jgi:branched-chain amino acid transport system ATP-binding protein
MVPEGRGVFARMTITENLQMGAYTRNDEAGIKADIDRMFETFPRLKERANQLAGTMSGGEQQMLAMARALMSQPKLLLLDEPSMGLSPIMVEKIFEVVRTVSSQGVTVLLVEQNARLALQAAHRGYVMESGLITMSGDAKQMLDDPKVRAAYLGSKRPVVLLSPACGRGSRHPVLQTKMPRESEAFFIAWREVRPASSATRAACRSSGRSLRGSRSARA